MASRDDRDKVIRDPVHNLIRLPRADRGLLLKLLDSPALQRLRRIRQLGVAYLVYPGAEHSRWAHSLGVYHVARRMIDALARHYDQAAKELKELKAVRRHILAAALLHDVGHGPFSHLFENALPRPLKAPRDYPDDHEAWSRRIVKERFTKILGSRTAEAVADLLDNNSRKNLLAKDFVSSQLDADRLDFVLRDRHSAGVRYGAFDLEWILYVIRIGAWSAPGSRRKHWRLCFLEEKAAPVITEFLQARAYLYRQVYIHKSIRRYEALLRNILAYATDLAERDPALVPSHTPPVVQKLLMREALTTAEYLVLDDFRVLTMLADWSASARDEMLKRMCERLVNRGPPYQAITLEQDAVRRATELMARLKHEGSPVRFRCHLDNFSDLAYKDVFGGSAKDYEERQYQSVLLTDDSGNVRFAGSNEWIRKTSEFEVEAKRLYYDDQDQETVRCLRAEHLLKRGQGRKR